MKPSSKSKRYIIAGFSAAVSLGVSLAAGFMILVMFGFWWESHSNTSIFYKHPLLLHVPILAVIAGSVAVAAYRRYKDKAFSIFEVISYVTMPVFALLVYLTFSGAFGPQPTWL